MNEWILQTGTENDENNTNILNEMKKYKDIFKEYLQNNFKNEITDFDLYFIYNYAKDGRFENLPKHIQLKYSRIRPLPMLGPAPSIG